ncbi:unnamed protein product [Aphanomyces euteiches]|uniref:RxLR effector protein n=1 Tax=Aphanomyces euteiches TaxID=100861 RepID=A0A6G0WRP8_9STRA|nr:hypothetical protein Ae201684_012383 [Aphanomyces euteiches]KAH9090497.1 hypothetical protein Ae201684P_014298 [Aphanomyces euteiches]KAH9154657.1 hypothetical protein AeRB84_003292 [Aphanomyces euteiches]
MTKLVRIVLLLALFLVQTTMAYLPDHLRLERKMVPYRHQNDKGEMVEEMVEKITATDPDDKSPTAKKPAKKQFFFAALRMAKMAVKGVKAGVSIVNHIKNKKKKL